jgi:hypothetical protein
VKLLQHPVKVDGVFEAGSKGTHPGKVVLSGSLCVDVLGVAFQAHPPKGALRSRQSILPCSNGSFQLSSSLSWVRSCSCSSMTNANVAAALEGGGREGLHQPTSNDQLHDKKQAQATAIVE